MKFYRVSLYDTADGSFGYEWYTSHAEALKAQKKFAGNLRMPENDGSEIETVDVEPTKRGILKALRDYADYANNG